MATEATTQVLETAVDAAGVSVVTTTRTVDAPRNGTVYNPATLAAGVPVWFHRLQDGRYLALYSTHWTDGTGAYGTGAQLFSAHTEVTTPVYLIVDPTTGTADGPYPLPTPLDTLVSAVSRGDYLFTVGVRGIDAWVQHYRITRFGRLTLVAEELAPTAGFRLGLYADPNYLWVFGDYGDGKLARVRKNWGDLGQAGGWEYEGLRGWYSTIEDGVSMVGDLPAAGPCSVAKFRDRYYVVTTAHSSGAYFAKTYTQRAVDQKWTLTSGDPLALGADAVYMGGAAYLQPQLVANKALLPDAAASGFPYVTSVKFTSGGNQAIITGWGLLAV